MNVKSAIVPMTLLLVFLLLLAGAGRRAAAEINMNEAKVIGAYPLTTEKMQQKFAVAADMARLAGSDPDFGAKMQATNEPPRLEEQIRAMGSVPKAVALMQSHSLSVRDYCLTTLAIAYAQIAQATAQLRPAHSPADDIASVAAPPAHVEFVRAHHAEILALTSAIAQARQDRHPSK